MTYPRHRFLISCLSLVAASLTAALAHFGDALDRSSEAIVRGMDFVWAFFALAFRTDAPRFSAEGWGGLTTTGIDLDPSLLNSLRHEAGTRSRSAGRHR